MPADSLAIKFLLSKLELVNDINIRLTCGLINDDRPRNYLFLAHTTSVPLKKIIKPVKAIQVRKL